jgi:endoglucanase
MQVRAQVIRNVSTEDSGPTRRTSRGVGFLCAALVLVFSVPSPAHAAPPEWPLWDQYAQHFIDGQGRVIERSQQDRTTSEGQAYAMFFAVAGNDRARFAGLLNWTEANLAGGDLTLHLPAWSWGKAPDGSWKILDPNPATDADLWMAYALIEGGRLWNDERYDKLGRILAERIAKEETVHVPGLGTTLQPGPIGFHPDDKTWLLNPSYLPLPVLARLAQAMPKGPWAKVEASLGEMLRHGSGAGFAMDWVSAGDGGVHPSVTPKQLADSDKSAVPVGSYDAIRVYLWLGISDPLTPGVHALLVSVPGMAAYLKTNLAPPLTVDSAGKVLSPDGTVAFSAAVVPYLDTLNLKASANSQMDRLFATRDPATGLYGRGTAYYDQNLALFSTGWADRHYRFDRDGRLKVKWTPK